MPDMRGRQGRIYASLKCTTKWVTLSRRARDGIEVPKAGELLTPFLCPPRVRDLGAMPAFMGYVIDKG